MDESELKADVEERTEEARRRVGEEMRHSVRQAAAWRCFAELVRRHPELWVLELHGGGGQYDELAVWEPKAGSLLLQWNYLGSLHMAHVTSKADLLRWTDLFTLNPRSVLARIEKVTRLGSPRGIPHSTPRVLTYRAIAHLAGSAAFDRRGVSLVNGFYDSSGYVQGPREGSFEAFPSIQAHRRHSSEYAPNGVAEYRFWFAYEAQGEDEPSKPLVAFETTGHAWKPGEDAGERFDFVRMYDTVGRDFDRLMAAFHTWRAAG